MIDDSWSDEDRRRITWTCKDCGVTTDANLRDGTWHTCSGRATLPRGAQPAEQASYDDGPRWPPTPPDTGLSPADGPFTDQTLTVMASASQEQASGEASPTRGLSSQDLRLAHFYDERAILTVPASVAAECGHATTTRWVTATGEWCSDCYALACRVLRGRP